MEKLVNIVAPRSLHGLLVKAGILVGCFTMVDLVVSGATGAWTRGDTPATMLVTFMVGAPFGLFVMAIMRAQYGLQKQLRYLSETDALTGLMNRNTFLDRASLLLNHSAGCSVLMIDVDHFKRINDTYGHHAGDVALTQIGQHLQRNLRNDDIVGRIGGEEFAAILETDDPTAVDRIAGEICQSIHINMNRASDPTSPSFSVTFSIGAVVALPGQRLIDLMKFADLSLYEAKKNGRNQVIFHHGDAHADTEIKTV